MKSGIETLQECGDDDDDGPIRNEISARTTGFDGKGVALGLQMLSKHQAVNSRVVLLCFDSLL